VILIISEDKIIGADKDFLDNFSLEELNKKFSIYLNKNEYEDENNKYEIKHFNVLNYEILIFSKKEEGVIDLENLLQVKVDENEKNEQKNLNSDIEDNNIIDLDNLLQGESTENENKNEDISTIDLDSLIIDSTDDKNIENNNLDLINESEIKPLDLNLDELTIDNNTPTISLSSQQEEITEFKIPKENPFELLKKRKEEKKVKNQGLKINFNKKETKKEEDEDIFCVVELFNKKREEIKEIVNKELEKASKELTIDMDTMHSFFNDIITQLKNEKDAVYKALDKADYDYLISFAHKIKTSLLNLRMTNLAEIFVTLDNMLIVRENISVVRRLVDKIYGNIDLFSNKKDELIIDANLSQRDREVRLRLVKTMLESLKDSNLDTVKSKLIPMYQKVPLLQLRDIINSSNANEAQEKIVSLINLIKKEGL
jgi:HPt (histidine-containing phosphotransfer) domain-containing protein